MATVAVLVAVVEAVLLVRSLQPGGSTQPPRSCLTTGYHRPAVRALDGAGTSRISVTAAGYSVSPVRNPEADQPRVQVAGELSSMVPAGRRLTLVEWGDPATRDSTPEHHPANGRPVLPAAHHPGWKAGAS